MSQVNKSFFFLSSVLYNYAIAGYLAGKIFFLLFSLVRRLETEGIVPTFTVTLPAENAAG